MAAITVDEIHEQDLPSIASFVVKQTQAIAATSARATATSESRKGRLLERLRWRLVRNPFRKPAQCFGHCLHDASGEVVGVNLAIPWRFIIDGKQLFGLGSSTTYVDGAYRGLGFLLFRKYFAMQPVDLWFANTANGDIGKLWGKFGAEPVISSDQEFALPLRAGPIVRDRLLRRGLGRGIARIAGVVAQSVNPILRLRRDTPRGLEVAETRDWPEVARLAMEGHDRDRAVCDHTIQYLKWSYEEAPAHEHRRAFLISRAEEHVGWFALAKQSRGAQGLLCATNLCDFALPASYGGVRTVVSLAAALAARDSDMLAMRGRCDVVATLKGCGGTMRRFQAPSGYVVSRTLDTKALAGKLVLATADLI